MRRKTYLKAKNVENFADVLCCISLHDSMFKFILHATFSNSLIIHQVKTKEITTVKEVWIPGLN